MLNYSETSSVGRDIVLNRYDSRTQSLNSQRSLKQKHDEIISNIENSKFGWLDIKQLLVSGIGFFTVTKFTIF